MRQRILLLVAMIAVVALAAAALYVDARREGLEAVADLARDQTVLADALASTGAAMATGSAREPNETLLERGDDGRLVRADGVVVESAPITQAMDRGDRGAKLTRAEARALGLPERTAVAGIARRPNGHAIAVVASAIRVRDREIRAQDRLLLGIVLVVLVAFGFGGLALREQRKEHLLERELLVGRAEKRGEERLARADKLATMGAFATGIAHEIATPLGVIAARTEMLAPRVQTDERSARDTVAIAEQIEKIRGIVESFLVLARGEAPTLAPIDARELIASAKAMVDHRLSAAGVALDIDEADAKPGTRVVGERRLLEQALVNLLINACDASRSGQHVKLSMRSEADHICFSVADDGVGIAADVAARATEPFFTTKPVGRGTGLGLAIVNEIAKHHQGQFTIALRKGGGTEARLELPARDASKEAA